MQNVRHDIFVTLSANFVDVFELWTMFVLSKLQYRWCSYARMFLTVFANDSQRFWLPRTHVQWRLLSATKSFLRVFTVNITSIIETKLEWGCLSNDWILNKCRVCIYPNGNWIARFYERDNCIQIESVSKIDCVFIFVENVASFLIYRF